MMCACEGGQQAGKVACCGHEAAAYSPPPSPLPPLHCNESAAYLHVDVVVQDDAKEVHVVVP